MYHCWIKWADQYLLAFRTSLSISVSGMAVQVAFSVPCRPLGAKGRIGSLILSKLLSL